MSDQATREKLRAGVYDWRRLDLQPLVDRLKAFKRGKVTIDNGVRGQLDITRCLGTNRWINAKSRTFAPKDRGNTKIDYTIFLPDLFNAYWETLKVWLGTIHHPTSYLERTP